MILLKKILPFIFTFPTVALFSQTKKFNYQKKGEYYYFGTYISDSVRLNRNPDSALYYFLKLQNQYPQYEIQKIQSYLADIYFEKGDYLKSLNYSKQVLSRYNLEDNLEPTYAQGTCMKIFKTYLMLKDYETALKYYDSSNSKYKTKFIPFDCIGDKLPYYYDLFTCFYQLGHYRNAISFLTEFMFSSYPYKVPDSVWNEYEIALNKIYTYDEIQKNISQCINDLEFSSQNEWDNYSSKFKIYSHYKYTLFEQKFEGSSYYSKDISVKETKEDFIKEILISIGFKKLYKP